MRTTNTRTKLLLAATTTMWALTACSGGSGGSTPPSPPQPGPVTLEFASDSITVDEGGAVEVTIIRTGGSEGAVSVDVESSDGTAGMDDYVPVSETVSFSAGETSKRISVQTADDGMPEPEETLSLTLARPIGATRGAVSTALVRIVDDEMQPQPGQPGTLQFSAASLAVDETAGTLRVTIARSAGLTGSVSVRLTGSNGTAHAGSDYVAVDEVVSFADGQETQSVSVSIIDDGFQETAETFTLSLLDPSNGATLGAIATTMVTIGYDDWLGPPTTPVLSVDANIGELRFAWPRVDGVSTYHLMSSSDDGATYRQVGIDLGPSEIQGIVAISVHRHDWARMRFRLDACNSHHCVSSNEVSVLSQMLETIGYFKASNTGSRDFFGSSVALSADGNTMAVGAPYEDSPALGVNSAEQGDPAGVGFDAGAVYVYARDAIGQWVQQAYVKASNTGVDDAFGSVVALSADGSTLAIGAPNEDSPTSGIDSDEGDALDPVGGRQFDAGAVYVYVRDDSNQWSKQAYIKASNTDQGDRFGSSLALSADGSTLAVGADSEDGAGEGVGSDQDDNTAQDSGAVYVFTREGIRWSQDAYLKASSTGPYDAFGWSVALSADGETLAVGAPAEDGGARGVHSDPGSMPTDDDVDDSGAVYVYTRAGTDEWSLDAYVKATNTGYVDWFGTSVALSGDGSVLAVGAPHESSAATGVRAPTTVDPDDDDAYLAGAVYLYARSASSDWSPQAYVKAFNTSEDDYFGTSLALSGDGKTLAVGAYGEASGAVGVQDHNSVPSDEDVPNAGAVYVYLRDELENWTSRTYVKASNTQNDRFGGAIALSADGGVLAVGARVEDSAATGIGGDQANEGASNSGAVYVY